jgi:hypothetical protein
MKTLQILLAALVGFAGSVPAQDTDRDLRSGKLPQRTAQVSEEVAMQGLNSLGITEIQGLKIEGGRWTASGNFGGRRLDLVIDAATGHMGERGEAGTIRPLPSPGIPTVRDHSIKIERSEIPNRQVVVEPFAPDRATATRPIGDRPVSTSPDTLPVERPTKPPAK